MNNTFHARRCGLLFKKMLLERPVQFFGFTVLILAFDLILYTVAKTFLSYGAAQNLSFIWGLAGGGCFLASFIFAYFSSNASGSSYLTLPASHFEKWLCGIFIAGILYPLVFISFFRLMDAGFVALYHNGLDPNAPFYKEKYESVFLFPVSGIVASKVFPIFFFLSGAMLCGPLFFNKLGFIKVALVLVGLCIVGFGLNWFLAKAFFGDINDASPFNWVRIPVGKEEGSIQLPETTDRFYHYGLSYVIPLILWGLAFIRLREKEF